LYLSREGNDLNPNHTYAIQPIVSRIANSEGFSDYSEGLNPDVVIDEKDFLEDFKPLGDSEEPLLAEAIKIITGEGQPPISRTISSTGNIGYNFTYRDERKQRLERAILDCLEQKE
ncbi:MAG: hypothetical protein OXH57_13165, partial [Ekhidna sp.]|nr:hypothetical protein [Ekhidna sp.]